MNEIFSFLESREIDEIGFLDTLEESELQEFIDSAMGWIQRSQPTNPRTVWFEQNIRLPTTLHLPGHLKSRFIPMSREKLEAWAQAGGPFPAVATRREVSVEGLVWRTLFKEFGTLENVGVKGGWILWTWKPFHKWRRALMICHHCGVLPDLRRQLLIHGVRGEFVWLCDGKPPTGDAWPSSLDTLTSSVPLLRGPIEGALKPEVIQWIRGRYSIVCTSHCMRYPLIFAATGLPLLHINSTRFGNEITCRPAEFADLRRRIQGVVATGQLTVVHNNEAERWYSAEYLGPAMTGFRVLPSLCEQGLRFRIRSPPCVIGKRPYLVWDTRFHVVQGKGSKTLRAIVDRLRERVDVSSELVAKKNGYLDDDMLEDYQAVIHIPYNISTMSFFEQGSANIPVWLPTPRFLKQILADPEEHSELSWYCFNPGVKGEAERPDQVWEPAVIEEYVKRSDFHEGVFRNLFFFDTIDELAERIDRIDYDAVIKSNFVFNVGKKVSVAKAYAAVLEGILDRKG